MFTGLVEKTGRIRRLTRAGDSFRVEISHEPWSTNLQTGESIAVNGTCLTVVSFDASSFVCDMLAETFNRTTFRVRKAGDAVNLERALKVGDRIGGHFVSGHVDGTGTVSAVRNAGRDRIVTVACLKDICDGIVLKGSIAIDGISLTVSSVGAGSFEVNLIPHTWDNTTFVTIAEGVLVNLETDLLGKFVRKQLDGMSQASPVTVRTLQDAGFM